MKDSEEYAPLYTQRERVRLAVIYTCVFLLVSLVSYIWLLPELEYFMSTAHCQTFYGYQGILVMVYGLFVGIPVLTWMSLQIAFTWQGVRIILHRQSPPVGTKVLRKTVIVKGREAVMKGWLMILLVPAFFIMVIPWGIITADELLQSMDLTRLDYATCVELYEVKNGLR